MRLKKKNDQAPTEQVAGIVAAEAAGVETAPAAVEEGQPVEVSAPESAATEQKPAKRRQGRRKPKEEVPAAKEPTFAAEGGDPLTVVSNLSDFIFSLIRAVGLILLDFGVLQVGLPFQSHDPSQRPNGMLTIAGGIVITFTREILTPSLADTCGVLPCGG